MKHLWRTMPGKTGLILAFNICVILLVGCVTAAAYLISEDLYHTDFESYMTDFYRRQVISYPWEEFLLKGEQPQLPAGMAAILLDEKGREVVSIGNIVEYGENYEACGLLAQQMEQETETVTSIPKSYYEFDVSAGNVVPITNRQCMMMDSAKRYLQYVYPVKLRMEKGMITEMYVRTFEIFDDSYSGSLIVYVGPQFFQRQGYAQTEQFMELAFEMKYKVYPIGVAAGVGCVLLFVLLMTVAGRRPGTETITPGLFTGLPLDGILAGLGVLLIGDIGFLDDADYWIAVPVAAVSIVVGINLFLGLCMTIATRLKLHVLLKNNLTWKILAWVKKMGALFFHKAKRFFEGTAHILRQIPLIWKTALALAVLVTTEFIGILGCYYETDIILFLWLLEKTILVPAVLWLALGLKRLQQAGAKLADGDLSYRVNTKNMYWEVKRHGENLNRISLGMTHAVEQRLKSERMKTELITNVSHDIKTPLTSIINYTGLVEQEAALLADGNGAGGNGNSVKRIQEYAQVLTRQSNKLKRLLEDLVEASKASTGNLEILPEPCDAGLFISQAAGEYEEKLKKADLILVAKKPDESVSILADSRRMWRVFDNLMNNICKYSQSGTRVYLSLDIEGEAAVIRFRNTSREELNISAEELMERFVRGDSSRNTEGNGLGLSIARSLTELQGGTFSLDVDGDLFKVTLRFPIAK